MINIGTDRTFNFFSLDYVYYPVSGIMKLWHWLFGSIFGPTNAWGWVLSVVFLVYTLRLIMFRPFMKQMDSQIKMQAMQPEMKKLREKYKDDKQRLGEEMMKLQKEHGVSMVGGCLPALIQAPVFIGLFHVLRMFQPLGDGQYRPNNYIFSKQDILDFAAAKIFDHAPLGATMIIPHDQLTQMGGVRAWMVWVGVPLTILAGILTHLTSRRSVARQRQMNPEAAAAPQAAMMNKVMLYLFPIGVMVGGPFMPLAILFYWLANNSWTFGQLWVAHKLQDRRNALDALVVEEEKESQRFSTPRPGARPAAPRSAGSVGSRPAVRPEPRDATTSAGRDVTKSAGRDVSKPSGRDVSKPDEAAGPSRSRSAGTGSAKKPTTGARSAPRNSPRKKKKR